MTQNHDFGFKPRSRLAGVAQHADEKESNCDHQPQLCCDSSTTATPPDGVFGSDRDRISDFAKNKAATLADAGPETLQLGIFKFSGEMADLVKQDFEQLARTAYRAQGSRAFEDPKSAAVVHEAGHAVLYAYYGLEMRFVKVWQRKKGIHRGHWAGQAQPAEHVGWCTGPDTSPEQDLKDACILMAGWLAEVLFDNQNLRLGSSLDERTYVGLLSHNISQKAGVDLHRVRNAICSTTCSILKKNESVVREIASMLDHDGCIRREALSSILAKVERPS